MHKESLFNGKVISIHYTISWDCADFQKSLKRKTQVLTWRSKVSLVPWKMLLEETSSRNGFSLLKKKKKTGGGGELFQTHDLIIYCATFVSIILIFFHRNFIVTHRAECVGKRVWKSNSPIAGSDKEGTLWERDHSCSQEYYFSPCPLQNPLLSNQNWFQIFNSPFQRPQSKRTMGMLRASEDNGGITYENSTKYLLIKFGGLV